MAIDITAPVTLHDPGYYRLINDVMDCSENKCIDIQGSNIVLDGNGHSISGNNSGNSGVWIEGYCHDIEIKNLKLSNFKKVGIYSAGFTHNILITNCDLTNNKANIWSATPKNFIVRGNSIKNGLHGIMVFNPDYPNANYTISENVITNNEWGIRTNYVPQPMRFNIENNRILENNKGIDILSDYGTIYSNVITNNQCGLILEGNFNLIYNNLFDNEKNIDSVFGEGNRLNISKKLGTNIIDGPYLGGNAYFHPDGSGFSQTSPDIDRDGICDSVCSIPHYNIDYFPLKSIYGTDLVLEEGWNFISVPKTLTDGYNTAGYIFQSVDTGMRSIYYYDACQRTWEKIESTDIIEPLKGYWIYSTEYISIPLKLSQDPIPTNHLCDGWNAIGPSGFKPVAAKETLYSVNDKWCILIDFEENEQQYGTSIVNGGSDIHSDQRTMNPMNGYWLFMNTEGDFVGVEDN